jgi:peptidoglycan/LPS O-acetylase OafA/YrhL
MKSPSAGWNFGIQRARGVAVLFVVLFHFFDLSTFWGSFGVNLFFCISGYLMIQILTRSAQTDISIKKFLKKRLVRLYPALFSTIMFIWTISFLDIIPGDSFQYLLTGFGYLVFVGNFAGLFIPGTGTSAVALGHMWTLALEWQLYVLLAIVVKLFYKNRNFRKVVFLVFGVSSFSILFSIFLVDVRAPTIILNSLVCSLCFLLGAIVFFVENYTTNKAFVLKLSAFIICLFSNLQLSENLNQNSRQFFTSLQVASFSFLVFLICKDLKSQSFSPLDFVGRISYSWYLLHYPMYFLMNDLFLVPNIATKLAFMFLSGVLAYFSWLKIESHFWKPSRGHEGRSC